MTPKPRTLHVTVIISKQRLLYLYLKFVSYKKVPITFWLFPDNNLLQVCNKMFQMRLHKQLKQTKLIHYIGGRYYIQKYSLHVPCQLSHSLAYTGKGVVCDLAVKDRRYISCDIAAAADEALTQGCTGRLQNCTHPLRRIRTTKKVPQAHSSSSDNTFRGGFHTQVQCQLPRYSTEPLQWRGLYRRITQSNS